MSYNEASFQSDYNKWKAHNYKVSCPEELKICKNGDRFNLNKIEKHQISNLYNAKHAFIQHKIPDLGNQNPFDSFSYYKSPAWIVIMWYEPRKEKKFYMIDIDTVCGLIDDGKKSISEIDAVVLCDKTGILK